MRVMGGCINADGDEADEALTNDVTDLEDVDDRPKAVRPRFPKDPQRISPISRPILHAVVHVRPHLIDAHVDLILEKELTDVLNVLRSERPVLCRLPIHMNFHVNMSGTTGIITGEDRRKSRDAQFVRRPGTAKPLFFKIGTGIRGQETGSESAHLRFFILVARFREWMTSVMTGGVGMPYIDQGTLDRLTRVDIDDPDIQVQW